MHLATLLLIIVVVWVLAMLFVWSLCCAASRADREYERLWEKQSR